VELEDPLKFGLITVGLIIYCQNLATKDNFMYIRETMMITKE